MEVSHHDYQTFFIPLALSRSSARRGAVALVAGAAGLGGVAGHFLGGPAWLTDALWLFAAAVAGTEVALRAFSALRAGSISIELLVTVAAVDIMD